MGDLPILVNHSFIISFKYILQGPVTWHGVSDNESEYVYCVQSIDYTVVISGST